MMLNQKTALIDETRSIINRILRKENIRDSASDVYELMRLLAHPTLEPIVQRIFDEDAPEVIDCNNKVQAIAKPVLDVSQEIIRHFSTNASMSELVSNELQWLQPNSFASNSQIALQICALKRIFKSFYRHGVYTDPFLQQFATFDHSENITLLFIDEDSFYRDIEELRRLSKVNAACSIQMIFYVGQAYSPQLYNQIRSELEKSKHPIVLWQMDLFNEALDNAINPGKDNILYQNSFDAYDLKDHAERIHHRIIRCLTAEEEQKADTAHDHPAEHVTAEQVMLKNTAENPKHSVIAYDEDRNILFVKGHAVALRRIGKGYAIIGIVASNIEAFKTERSWDEIHELLEGKEPPHKNKAYCKRYKRSLRSSCINRNYSAV